MQEKKLENSWLVRFAPPGIPLTMEVSVFMVSLAIAAVGSLLFIHRYMQERSMLFIKVGSEYVVLEGAKLPHFYQLTEKVFDLFGLVVVFCVVLIAYHYIYHYQGSRMMYLMKRLPNRFEWVRRCMTLPVLAIGITFIVRFCLELIYYGIYLIFTPAECLPF